MVLVLLCCKNQKTGMMKKKYPFLESINHLMMADLWRKPFPNSWIQLTERSYFSSSKWIA